MVDKNGHDYEELKSLQHLHLLVWQARLQPAIFAEVRDYILSNNRMAPTPNDKHQVLRGSDLSLIIYDWPNPNVAYPQRGSELV
jgi:hypothetical protein